jgi:hypothetical protein
VFLFPIARADFNRVAGLEAFESEGFEFVLRGLVVTGDSLDVRLNGDPCGFRSGPELGF